MSEHDAGHEPSEFEDIPPVRPTPQSMADMAKVASIVEMLDFYEFDFTEEPGWETRQVTYQWESGGPFGVMVHHTVSVPYGARSAYPAPEGLRTDGRVIANALVQPDGTINLVAAGPANYSAGTGKKHILENFVIARQRFYGPQTSNDDVPAWYGNRSYINIEVVHRGDSSFIAPAQEKALIGLIAVTCFVFDWDSTQVIAHEDHSRRKIDPQWSGDYADPPYSMTGIQDRVQEILDANDMNPEGDNDMDLERWATRLRNPLDFDRMAAKGVISPQERDYWITVPTDSPEMQDLRDAVTVRNPLWTS